MSPPRRYLVSFNPKRTPHLFTDVLIIGGGIAGLRAALAVPPNLDVLVVTKSKIQQSNSSYAQGGIATVLSTEDRFENHIEDTLIAGAGLCDRAIVELVVREAPPQIFDLIDWGTKFDLEDGQLALTREGGHSHRRIVHALGDATGHEVMRAIIDRARQAPHVALWEDTFTLDLLTGERRGVSPPVDGPACLGALVHRPPDNRLLIWAKQTILASGGAGMIYRETTNPHVATGDGMALAARAGAQLRDMEFMQFHPTVLYVAGSSRFLISEAVRGEGAYLRDKTGQRFMPDVDPRAELAPRDVVAQAIFRRMEETRHPNVYLDLSHLDRSLVLRRFPGIAKVCQGFGLDITRDWIPIRPGAHYMIGGVTVNAQGQTTLPGLWAAGEVTSSGLHGANRLASNSLLEGLVFGAACGKGAAAAAQEMADTFRALPLSHQVAPFAADSLDVADITNSLRSLMVRQMGVIREGGSLKEAAEAVAFWRQYVQEREFAALPGWELQNMLLVAERMIASARERKESRGVHFRSDFPQRDDSNWQHHIVSETIDMRAAGISANYPARI